MISLISCGRRWVRDCALEFVNYEIWTVVMFLSLLVILIFDRIDVVRWEMLYAQLIFCGKDFKNPSEHVRLDVLILWYHFNHLASHFMCLTWFK